MTMAIFRKDGNDPQRQRQGDQSAMVRPNQPELVRDPFQLMSRDPFRLMRDMMVDPFRVFQQMAPWGDVGQGRELAWNPSFEIRETDDAFLFKGDMPGVKQEDLDIHIVGNTLQISGKREREEEKDEGTLHTYECSYGSFSRSFSLPDSADLDKVRCDLKNGVLTLAVPKKAGTAPHRRKIQIGGPGSKS
jgi:HSP20 family protein